MPNQRPTRSKLLLQHRRDVKKGHTQHKKHNENTKNKLKKKFSKENNESSQRSGRKREPQRWTELTAVGQILADQVHVYLHPENTMQQKDEHIEPVRQDISSGEERHLKTWSQFAQKKIHGKTSTVLLNVELVSDLRNTTTRVQHLRDDVMVLRTQTKRYKEEAHQLQKEIDKTEKKASSQRRASCFLSALENLSFA